MQGFKRKKISTSQKIFAFLSLAGAAIFAAYCIYFILLILFE